MMLQAVPKPPAHAETHSPSGEAWHQHTRFVFITHILNKPHPVSLPVWRNLKHQDVLHL